MVFSGQLVSAVFHANLRVNSCHLTSTFTKSQPLFSRNSKTTSSKLEDFFFLLPDFGVSISLPVFMHIKKKKQGDGNPACDCTKEEVPVQTYSNRIHLEYLAF